MALWQERLHQLKERLRHQDVLQGLPIHPHQPALCPPVVARGGEFRRFGCGNGGLFNKPDLADLAVGIAEHHIPALVFRQVVVAGIPPAVGVGLGPGA